jgi:hypothetical protein
MVFFAAFGCQAEEGARSTTRPEAAGGVPETHAFLTSMLIILMGF